MKLHQYSWEPEDLIGRGTFAEVFLAKDSQEHLFALKIYTDTMANIDVSKGGSNDSHREKYSLEAEFEKGYNLAHTNVIKYLGLDYIVHTDYMQRSTSYPVLIMEYADKGSLEERLKSRLPVPNANEGHALSEEDILKMIPEILNGLGYLHSQHIIHRDLKPANILFKTNRVGTATVKLSDFGISRDLLKKKAAGDMPSTTGVVGTLPYMAPEQFLPKAYGLNGIISTRTDIWAFGIILYRMLSGKLPFGNQAKDYESLQNEIINTTPDYSIIPKKYHTVLRACLQRHAHQRPADTDAVLALLSTQQVKQPVPFDPGATIVQPAKPQPTAPSNNKKTENSLYVWIPIAAFVGILLMGIWSYTKGRGHPVYDAGDSTASYAEAPIDSSPMSLAVDTVVKTVDTDKESVYVIKQVIFKGTELEYQYTGWLLNGLPNGKGEKIFPDGSKFVGESVNGRADGKGTKYLKDGGVIEGEWKGGSVDGQATWFYANGDKYVGSFKDAQYEGYGTYHWKSGELYEGYWKNSKRNGQGHQTYANGEKYTGEFTDDHKDGLGTYYWLDGKKYTGLWTNDQRNGPGKMYAADGSLLFSGTFSNGTFTSASADSEKK